MITDPCPACGTQIADAARICSRCGKEFRGDAHGLARAWMIGSAPVSDVVVAGATVSRRHCRLVLDEHGYSIEDLGSSNGTYVRGHRIHETVRVEARQPITLGRGVAFPWDEILNPAMKDLPATPFPADAKIVRVGRNPDNDVVLDDPAVSGYHALLHLLEPSGAMIEDLGSLNGTSLNSVAKKIRSAPLSPADVVQFGSYKISGARLLKLAQASEEVREQEPSTTYGGAVQPNWYPELASVVFADIVGFTRLNPTQQMQARLQLEGYVLESEAFGKARKESTVIVRPTGDGMALVFFTHPSVAAECAVQIARMIGNDGTLSLRIGLNQGTVYRLKDINGNEDVNGSGINMAQRIMDCADCGEIFISASVADALRGTMDWHEFIRPMGTRQIKHGDSIEVFGLSWTDFGKNVA